DHRLGRHLRCAPSGAAGARRAGQEGQPRAPALAVAARARPHEDHPQLQARDRGRAQHGPAALRHSRQVPDRRHRPQQDPGPAVQGERGDRGGSRATRSGAGEWRVVLARPGERMSEAVKIKLSKKDLESDQDVRWCPGCGDYAILATVQRTLAQLGVKRETTVFISGIGCSSRFPYYMNTYGFHTIHGRAPAIASGLKVTRPDLDVWVITGDGDGLSIGGNHMIHALRRNMDLKIILFNNQIYGLTKGQYSPTSALGTRAASTPSGSVDHPLNPISLALGACATFVARANDTDAKLLRSTRDQAYRHKGS